MLVFSKKGQAQLLNSFDIHYQVQQKGSIVFVSNAAVTCASGGTCTTGRNEVPPSGSATNNGFTMNYINIDATTPGITMSSSDSLNLPNCSEVTWAGLYWGGNIATTTTGYSRRDSVKLKANSGTYLDLKADTLTAGPSTYFCFKDITSIVKANGIKTRYTLGNMVVRTGSTGRYGGWTIVVAYKNEFMDLRNLTVFSGLANVSNTASTNTVDIPISGFLTPPSGPVTFELGIIGYDGDRGSTGDSLLFKSGSGSFVPISDAVNPANDIFNSTLSNNGTLTSFRNPSYNNNLGFDADILRPNNTAKTYLNNSVTSATIRQRTGSETILSQVVTSAIDVYEPDMYIINQVADLNGGSVLPGDTLEYTMTAKNLGSDISLNTVVYDTMTFNVDLVPNSIQIVTGPNPGYKTDVAGDDQAEYDAATRSILVRIGTGANSTTGGQVINSPTGTDSTVVKFRVKVTQECLKLMCNTIIANRGYMKGAGQISGNYLIGASNPGNYDAFGCPNKGTTSTTIVAGTCPAMTVSSNNSTCTNDTIKLYGPTVTNANYSWTGPASFTSNIQNPIIPNATTAITGTYTLSITFYGDTCSEVASTFVTVIPASAGGTTLYSGGALCTASNSGTITLSGQTGSVVKWQTSTNGGTTWSDIVNTTASYNFSNAVNNQQYRAVVNNGLNCVNANSILTTITVNTPSVGGTTSYPGGVLCSPTNGGNITLSGHSGGVVKWQTSTNGGTSWSDIVNTTASYTFTNAVNNQQYRAVVNNGGGCSDANSSATTITVNNPSVGGTTSYSGGTLCSATNSGTITLSSHTGSVVKWQTSTNGGTTWSDILNTTASYTFTNAVNNQQYRAVVNNGTSCLDANSSVTTLTVLSSAVGGTTSYSGGILCSPTNSGTITLSGHTGSIVKWQTSTNGGTSWSDIVNSTTSHTFNNAVNNQQYRAVVNNGTSCSDANSSAVTITIDLPTITGLSSSNPTLASCPALNDGSITVTASGSNLQYSKDNGATWQASNVFSGLTAGSYTIKIRNSVTTCEYTYTSNPVVLSAPTCFEICNDGVDNDGNGLTDCEDMVCKPVASILLKRE